MGSMFDLRQCAQCGVMHPLYFKGDYCAPTGSYWYICPNSGQRVEFTSVLSSGMRSPPDAIECFCVEADDENNSPSSPRIISYSNALAMAKTQLYSEALSHGGYVSESTIEEKVKELAAEIMRKSFE
jgi:hypothetical protein